MLQTKGSAVYVMGEALMDCIAQSDASLKPCMGGSPFNFARAAALRGAEVCFVNPLSSDSFGEQMRRQLAQDGVKTVLPASRLPTSLAVVQIKAGQASYAFYRQGIADRDYNVEQILSLLSRREPGVLNTGSLLLIPPESDKVQAVLQGAKRMGWTISMDVNMRPQIASDVGQYVKAVKLLLPMVDWVKASDEDLALLGFAAPTRTKCKDIAKHFTDMGASRVAFTFGSEGAWLHVEGETAEQDVPAIALVDSVGAGDTFWGNCVADWVLQTEGAASRVAHTLQQAMHAAAINCTREGCQPPTYAALL